MVGLDIDQHKLNVDEIDFKGDATDKGESTEQPRRGMAEDLAHQEHCADGQRDVDHPLGCRRKGSMAMTFHIDAIPEGEEENEAHPQPLPKGGESV